MSKNYVGLAGKLREAAAHAGVKLYDDKVFSDKRKGNTQQRLKLWRCPELYAATPAQQKMFMERLKHHFGNRVVEYGHWVSTRPYNFQSFYITVLK